MVYYIQMVQIIQLTQLRQNPLNKEKMGSMQFIEKKNVYENIVEELKTLIENGVLRYGDKLPSVRAYAVDKKVNPNTVAKAYSVLEQEGYIRVELKKGAYVCYGEAFSSNEQASEVKQKLLAWKTAGIPLEEIEKTLKEVYGEGEEV